MNIQKLGNGFQSINRAYIAILEKTADINLDRYGYANGMSTLPSFTSTLNFFYAEPEFKVSQTFFFDVFTKEFWLAVTGVVFLIIILAFIFHHFVLKEDIGMVGFVGIFVLTGQGLVQTSSRISWSIFFIVVGMFSFMFASTFNMFLTSFLSAQIANLPFTTVAGIADARTHVLCLPISADNFDSDKKWDGVLNTNDCAVTVRNIFSIPCNNKKIVLGAFELGKR